MRLFSMIPAGRHSQSATPMCATAEANGGQPLRAVNPWRRSVKATGAFLLCVAIAGGIMLMDNPIGAQAENSSSGPNTISTEATTTNNPSSQQSAAGTQTRIIVDATADPTSTSTSVVTTTRSANVASDTSHTSVTVNGQNVPVPSNGSSQQTITDTNGTTQVSISNTSTGNESSSGGSSTSVNISGNSFSAESVSSQTYTSGGGAY